MLKNSPDTFSTQVVYLIIHWLIGEKETDKKKTHLFVGTTITFLQKNSTNS